MKRKLLLLSLLLVLGAYVYINDQKLFVETPPVTTKKRILSKAVKPKTSESKKPTLSGLPALFPSGPMIWIHLKDLGKIAGQIKKSNFYKQAVEYKIYNPSKPFPTNIKSITKGRSIFSKIYSQFEEKTLMDFLGQEVGLAFYPPDKAGKSHYYFVAKISAAAKIQEKLQRTKDSLFGNQTAVAENNYKGKSIITYQNKEQKYSFNYIIAKNYILGSSSETVLKKGIDLMEGNSLDLFINSKEFKSLFKTSDFSLAALLFVDIEKISPNISSSAGFSKKISPKAVEEAKKDLQSFKHLGFTFKAKKGLEIKSVLTINKEKADKELLQTINIESRKLKSLKFMPRNAIIYGANIFKPTQFFEHFIKGLKKKADKKSFETFFHEFTGVDLKEIIPFIGNEFFYSVSAPQKTAPVQIPGITIGLQIKEREKISALLKKIQTNLTKSLKQESFKKESYEGFNINFLPIPFPVPIQPGYSIVENFLLLSVNQMEIKRFIDTINGKIPPLEKSKKYMSANIPVKNNGMFFVNAPLLRESLSEAITKTPAGFSSARSKQSAEKGMKSLDMMRVVESFNSVFMYKKNQIDSSTFIAMKDIPKVKTNKELLAFLEKARQKAAPPSIPPGRAQVKSLSPSSPSKFVPAQVSVAYVYDPAGKRNPFRSLLEGKQKEEEEKQIKEQEFAIFIKNIESLRSINLYLYNKIKRQDPVLYGKLKNHAHYFRNKKALEKEPQEKRVQKLEEYRRLISIAITNFHDTILGPLQDSQYSSFNLTGIIWNKKESTALIEMPDGKGYSVKKNDLIGPNYGVVKKIAPDKISVVEQYINSIGEITEKRKDIKLLKDEESV